MSDSKLLLLFFFAKFGITSKLSKQSEIVQALISPNWFEIKAHDILLTTDKMFNGLRETGSVKDHTQSERDQIPV